MKKQIIIIFSIFYLALVSGVNLNLHYCGGKIKSFSFFHSLNDIGCCGKKMTKKGCCQDKSTFIKLKEKHVQNAELKVHFDQILPVYITFNYKEISLITEFKNDNLINYHAPPPNYKIPIFLKNRVLVI